MKKSIILFLILSISLSANAAEYTSKNTRPCPQNKALVCSLKNKPITGVLKDYDSWGLLESEANYKNGKLDGLRKTYYQNGRLKSKIVFKEGKAISGFIYNEYGEKREMTNAQLHNMNMRY